MSRAGSTKVLKLPWVIAIYGENNQKKNANQCMEFKIIQA